MHGIPRSETVLQIERFTVNRVKLDPIVAWEMAERRTAVVRIRIVVYVSSMALRVV